MSSASGVKLIFKTLIGTMIIIVMASLLTELFNIQITTHQLRSLMRVSAKQAAELFAQETYKTDGSLSSGASRMQSMYCPDSGAEYVSGLFFSSSDPYTIWQDLYTKSEYESFVDTYSSNWRSLKLLDMAIKGNTSVSSVPSWDSSQAELDAFNDKMTAKTYEDNLYTPLNLGIPYLDEDTTEKMFRWNLSMLLSNCDSNAIRKDESGNYFVMYEGYRCYANMATIDNISYKVFDLTNYSDAKKFEQITHIDSSKLGMGSTTNMNTGDDERQRVGVAYITYSMPVSYEGVTPIKNIFEWIWDNDTRVKGTNSTKPTYTEYKWNLNTEMLTNDAPAGTLPTTNTLVYYLIR